MKSTPPSPAEKTPPNRGAAAPRRRRRLLPWIAGAGLLALIAFGLWPEPVAVEVARVTRGNVVVTVNEEGMTRVKNRYVISSSVAGHLQRIDWKAGANVVAGETVLAVLETSGADFLDARSLAQAEARVRATTAALGAAEAQKESATAAARMYAADFERLRRLREDEAISAQEFEVAQMRAATAQQEERAAQFALQVAQFELEQAQAVLVRGNPATAAERTASAEPLRITSPVDGRVLRVFQESARVVPAGMPLLEVGDPTDLELRIEVLSRDGVAIQPGARVVVEQWGGPAPLEARVRLVEPSAFTKISALGVEEQRVYVVADLVTSVQERPTLGDNYRIEGRVVTWEGNDVLHVPSGALFQQGGIWRTFVLIDGKAGLRDVKVGHTNGLETEIVAGLAEGDIVVVYPSDKVTEGARVRAVAIERR